ncbi:MAG TPA: hypothetical protein VMW81_01565 [Nitrospinota bacterium]|nr:hypothetical protein [Nitrospinota bacterium]
MKKIIIGTVALILVFAITDLVLADRLGFRGGFGLGHGLVIGGSGLEDSPFGDDRWHPCWEWGTKGPDLRITKEEAEEVFKENLASLENPDLRLGEIIEHDEYYEVEVLNRENIVVQKLKTDKDHCSNY